MRIGVVGHGTVGRSVARLMASNPSNQIVIYDKFQPPYDHHWLKDAVNVCDLVFLCVPTPAAADGSCDLSAVEESAAWITAPICIRSTVVPGTVDRLSADRDWPIAFSPEYLGENPAHPWTEDTDCGFVIVGGSIAVAELVVAAYRTVTGPEVRFYFTDARTAELCKYMENCFLATKVAFVNQFYDIAQSLGVDFEALRELWLADPRIGRSHTEVTRERGFRGRCLPKDIAALAAAMKPLGGAPLVEQVMAYNLEVCARADRTREEGEVRLGERGVP
jgi:UDPglucose 6-dehydrogenase